MKQTILLVLSASLLTFANAFAGDSVAAKEWGSYLETLVPLGERIVNTLPTDEAQDPQMRQEAYQTIYSTIAHGYFGAVYADPEYPDFIPYFNNAFSYLVANPDNVYYVTPIQGDGIYKISGYRGTLRYVNFTIGSGSLVPYGTGAFGPTLADHDIDELKINKNDGAFEVILSQARPQGYKGNWWKLDPKATNILVRQIAYDWLREIDARLAIERIDRPAIKPRQNATEIEVRLRRVAEWAGSWSTVMVDGSRRQSQHPAIWFNKDVPVNTVVVQDLNALGGLSTQQYYAGMFEIGPDEALILETEVPKQCRYWNIQLGDPLWKAIDYVNRQSNLNGFTAKVDKDGRFRAVISAQDPGVPNWLDTAGYQRGYIFGRWTVCSSHPQPAITKVKLADVRQHLPVSTPVVTAEARDASLRLRRQGAQLRRRW